MKVCQDCFYPTEDERCPKCGSPTKILTLDEVRARLNRSIRTTLLWLFVLALCILFSVYGVNPISVVFSWIGHFFR